MIRGATAAALLLFGLASPGLSFTPVDTLLDLDGDGLSDLILHDPGYQSWRAYNLNGQLILQDVTFGDMGGMPAPGRFLDNGMATLGFYRPIPGEWTILVSSIQALDHEIEPEKIIVQVKSQGKPLVGRFARADRDALALFDTFDRTWSAWTADGSLVFSEIPFGWDGLQFAAADLTGDGISELISYDQQDGAWRYISVTNPTEVIEHRWEHTYGVIIARDFNSDGLSDLGLWTNEGRLKIMDARTGASIPASERFGDSYSLPVHAYYEHPGRLNYAYFSLGRGVWHLLKIDGTKTSPNHPEEYQ